MCKPVITKSTQKNKYIIIKAPQIKCKFTGLNIYINGTSLSRVGTGCEEKSTKFLGVHIDDTLCWKSHVDYINKKISKSLFIIKQASHLLSTECLRTLYFALIHPYLNYGLLAWGNANVGVLHDTIILQKRAIRTISRSVYNSHTEPLYKELNILKLNDQFELNIIVFMNQFVNDMLPISFVNIYRFNYDVQNCHRSRQSNNLFIERCNTSFASKLPLFNFPKIWNKWIINGCNKESIPQIKIKEKVKSLMLKKYLDSVKCDNPKCRSKQCSKEK